METAIIGAGHTPQPKGLLATSLNAFTMKLRVFQPNVYVKEMISLLTPEHFAWMLHVSLS